MNPSQLQLAGYRLLDFRVTARSGIDPSLEDYNVLLNEMGARLDISHNQERDTEGSNCWSVFLALRFEARPEDHSPYDFHVVLVADFFCSKQLPATLDQETLVGVNGTSIVYGIARELVLTMTQRGLWGSLNLPTMSFINFRDLLARPENGELPK